MCRQFVKYAQLPWAERILLIYIYILLGIVRFTILVFPFHFWAAYLRKSIKKSPEGDKGETEVLRISRAIELMRRYTPWESKCLVQAITGKILLRQRRLKNTLYLGISKDQKNNLIAHAWLCSGKMVVTGGGIIDKFTVVEKFTDNSK